MGIRVRRNGKIEPGLGTKPRKGDLYIKDAIEEFLRSKGYLKEDKDGNMSFVEVSEDIVEESKPIKEETPKPVTRMGKIKNAVRKVLKKDREVDFTSRGVPTVEAIELILDDDITAEERDKAYEAVAKEDVD